jgi:GAF domain-containing protein
MADERGAGLEPDRLARVAAALAVGERDPSRSLCAACAEVIGVAGAGVVLVSGGASLGNVCASDPVTEVLEEAQYTLGEGPCVDACRAKVPVLVPDLGTAAAGRWQGFREDALRAGVRAAFGFPLLVREICIGALDVYHDQVGSLTQDQFADAVAVAHVVTRTVLAWQAVAPSGTLAWQLEQVPAHRAVVHQATGMVSVQAHVPIHDALALLRAHAFVQDRLVGDVATDVVAGMLRFN